MTSPAASRYWAFISYSHFDDRWGRWLHKALESYRVPARLVGRPHPDGAIPRRLFPVFRDRDELPSSSELGAAIDEALGKSRYQIVICSPHAAASRWVNEEIKRFKLLGREDRILALIVDGEPNADQAAVTGQPECFPPALRHAIDDFGKTMLLRREIIAADVRAGRDKRRDALLKLVSGVLGVSLDELKQRERTRARWRIAGYAALTATVLLMLLGVWQWQEQRREVQERRDRIARYIELGRKELDNEHPARAATYFSGAYEEGEDSTVLRYLLARAMRGVDPLVRSFRNDGGGGWLSAAFSPDGRHVALGGALSNVATIWDTDTAEPLQQLDQEAWVGSVGYSPDGKLVYTSSADRIVLWDAKSGEKVATVKGQAVPGTMLLVLYAHDSSQFFTFDASGQIRSYDGHTGAGRRLYMPAATPEEDWALSRDGTLLASAMGHKVQLWQTADGKNLGTLEGHDARVMSVDLSPDNRWVLSADTAGVVLLWDRATRKLAARLRGSGDEVWARFGNSPGRLMLVNRVGFTQWLDVPLPVAAASAPVAPAGPWLSPDGDWTSWAIAGNTFQVKSARSGQSVLSLEGHWGEIIDTRFAPVGLHVLSLARDGTAKLWDPPPLERPAMRDDEDLLYVGYGRDRGTILSLNAAGEVREWDAASSSERRVTVPVGGFGNRGQLSRDGWRAVILDRQSRNVLLDATNAHVVAVLEGHPGEALASFNRDGQRLITIDAQLAQVWDARTGERLLEVHRDGPGTGTAWAALAPDGLRLAVLRKDGVDIQPVAGGAARALHAGFDDVAALDWSTDDKRLVTMHGSGVIRIHDVEGDRVQRQVTLGQDCAGAGLHLSPYAQVAVISCGATPFLWQLDTRRVLPLSGHTADVLAVAFSPDGTRIATGAQDATVRIWDAATGELLDTLVGHTWSVHQLAFSPDGQWLLSGSLDRSIRQWEMIEPEVRTPAQIAKVMTCKSPWKLRNGTLLRQRADPMPCAGEMAP